MYYLYISYLIWNCYCFSIVSAILFERIKYLQVISILKYTFDLALSKLTNNIKIEVSSMYIARTLNNRFFSSKKFILSSKIN